MKKLLGLTGLATTLVLAACGGGSAGANTIVCTMETFGLDMTVTAQSEDGMITSAEVATRVALANLGLETSDIDLGSEETVDMLASMGFDGDVDLDGDYLVVTQTAPEELGLSTSSDEFVENVEADGGTCN